MSGFWFVGPAPGRHESLEIGKIAVGCSDGEGCVIAPWDFFPAVAAACWRQASAGLTQPQVDTNSKGNEHTTLQGGHQF